jgi:hypothetical protein
MSIRRPLADATQATPDPTAAPAEGDVITVLWRHLRGVRAVTGVEVKLETSPRVPATVAPGAIERLCRALEAGVADATLRGATLVGVELRADTGCLTLAVLDDRGGLQLTAAASATGPVRRP